MISIPGDIVNQATAELPDDQRSAIRWLHAHAVTKGWSLEQTAESIRRNSNTLYQVFKGSHGAGKAKIVEEILGLKKQVEARSGTDKLGFIETALSRKIWKLCDAALTYQRIAFIFGDSQIGKTENFREYQRTHNHGTTILITVPAGGSFCDLLGEFAEVLRISNTLKTSVLKRRIIKAFDNRMLLIIDEAHQMIHHGRNRDSMRKAQVIEFIREIHDRSGCGLVIGATNVFREEIETGASSSILSQLKRRQLATMQLPNVPTQGDLNTFAKSYDLDPATDDALELQTNILKADALGVWLNLLRMTSARCFRAKIPISWDQVIRSNDLKNKLATA